MGDMLRRSHELASASKPHSITVRRRAQAHSQPRGRPRREGDPRRLAAAAAAAVARRAALQRLGAGRRRRHRARRHRDARARLDGAPRARARPGRPEGRARAADRLHARPRRPLRPGAADRRARRLRGLDAPRTTRHHTAADDPEEALARRVVVAHQSGVPGRIGAALDRAPPQPGHAARPARCTSTASSPRATRSRPTSATGRCVETPGHAPSHICLYQPERRLLISGDHLLGRVSLYFDAGYTPDPVAEFLDSLDKVERLDARLALSGHGRPFTDVAGHVAANRALVAGAPRRGPGRARRPAHRLRDRAGGLRRALHASSRRTGC